jgi:hypothetical protein
MLVGCALVVAPAVAWGSTSFPNVVKDEWQLPGAAPACTLCHESLAGGYGTATKAFGQAVLRNGATAADTGALRRALRALAAAGSDVDHDGVSDIAELRVGADPDAFNDYGVDAGPESESFEDYPVPQTGCAVATVGRPERALVATRRLTGPQPSPTVGPTSGAEPPIARRISGDAFLVCGLIFGVFTRRLRLQRKRVASATR